MSDFDDYDCPICAEELDLADRRFRPCTCGFQICRFCWNRIRQESGLCPACRRPYSDNPVEFKPLTHDELAQIKQERRAKEKARKETEASARKQLANVRVVQKNLVYVVGLNTKTMSEDVLKSSDFFGQFGKIIKLVVNRRQTNANGQSGIYITYQSKDDAAKCVATIDGSKYDGRTLKASFGTTKYCTFYLRNLVCQNPNCMYLHEPGEESVTLSRDEALGRGPSRDHPALSDKIKAPPPPPTLSSFAMAALPAPKKSQVIGIRYDEVQRAKDSAPALPASASWAAQKANPAPSINLALLTEGFPRISDAFDPPPVSRPRPAASRKSSKDKEDVRESSPVAPKEQDIKEEERAPHQSPSASEPSEADSEREETPAVEEDTAEHVERREEAEMQEEKVVAESLEEDRPEQLPQASSVEQQPQAKEEQIVEKQEQEQEQMVHKEETPEPVLLDRRAESSHASRLREQVLSSLIGVSLHDYPPTHIYHGQFNPFEDTTTTKLPGNAFDKLHQPFHKLDYGTRMEPMASLPPPPPPPPPPHAAFATDSLLHRRHVPSAGITTRQMSRFKFAQAPLDTTYLADAKSAFLPPLPPMPYAEPPLPPSATTATPPTTTPTTTTTSKDKPDLTQLLGNLPLRAPEYQPMFSIDQLREPMRLDAFAPQAFALPMQPPPVSAPLPASFAKPYDLPSFAVEKHVPPPLPSRVEPTFPFSDPAIMSAGMARPFADTTSPTAVPSMPWTDPAIISAGPTMLKGSSQEYPAAPRRLKIFEQVSQSGVLPRDEPPPPPPLPEAPASPTQDDGSAHSIINLLLRQNDQAPAGEADDQQESKKKLPEPKKEAKKKTPAKPKAEEKEEPKPEKALSKKARKRLAAAAAAAAAATAATAAPAKQVPTPEPPAEPSMHLLEGFPLSQSQLVEMAKSVELDFNNVNLLEEDGGWHVHVSEEGGIGLSELLRGGLDYPRHPPPTSMTLEQLEAELVRTRNEERELEARLREIMQKNQTQTIVEW